jgi:DNA-binding response OmpR family regulator
MTERIMLIDDDPDVTGFVTTNLELEGFAVKSAATAEEGLAMGLADPPDLFMLDVSIGDGDGIDLLTRFRTAAGTANAPLMLLATESAVVDIVRGLDAGADDYIVKPFAIDELVARVRAVLRRSKAMRDLSPLTGLPGNFRIAEELERRISAGGPVAVIHGDLDNFKAYNDHYGFMRGDNVIKFTANTLLEAATLSGDPTAFIGHVGGDDFIMVMDPERVEAFCQDVVERFDDGILDFYDAHDALKGFVEVIDRRGERHSFPIVSFSLGAATNNRRSFTTEWEASAVASEMKEHAKSEAGSSYKIDRRVG